MENNKPTNEIQVELSEEMAQGTYANLAIISHSSSEFILDFIRVVPGAPKAQVKSRVILTPDNAKRLLFALQDNLAKFEEQANGKTAKLKILFLPSEVWKGKPDSRTENKKGRSTGATFFICKCVIIRVSCL